MGPACFHSVILLLLYKHFFYYDISSPFDRTWDKFTETALHTLVIDIEDVKNSWNVALEVIYGFQPRLYTDIIDHRLLVHFIIMCRDNGSVQVLNSIYQIAKRTS